MPAFTYVALDERGKEKKGHLEGDTPRHVRSQLRDKGLTPLTVEAVTSKPGRTAFSFRRGISNAELALFTRQLATLVRSGLPLEESLQAVSRQTENNRFRGIILGVRSRVTEGRSLANALGDFPNIFSPLFRASVSSGESSGHLDDILERLADYTETRQDLRRKVQAALYYPIFLVLFSFGIVAFLLASVVPKVVQAYESLDAQLPLITRLMIRLSDFLTGYYPALIAIAIIVVVGIRMLLRNPYVLRRWHRFILKLPVIGRLNRGLNTARFTGSLSMQVSAGVPALEAMNNSSHVINNLVMRDCVDQATRKVREGTGISQALSRDNLFPPITLHLIASGESSGRLDEMLERAAQDQERETETLVTALMSILEPVMILVMSGLVFVIIMAALLPIFNLNLLVQ